MECETSMTMKKNEKKDCLSRPGLSRARLALQVARVVGPKNFFAMACPVANVKDKFVAKYLCHHKSNKKNDKKFCSCFRPQPSLLWKAEAQEPIARTFARAQQKTNLRGGCPRNADTGTQDSTARHGPLARYTYAGPGSASRPTLSPNLLGTCPSREGRSSLDRVGLRAFPPLLAF